MKVLLLGDVVGSPGRIALQRLLPDLKKELHPDLVIANVENMAHGFGITPETIEEAQESGVDIFTSGNHAWKNTKGVQLLREEPEHIVVPANVRGLPGRGITHVSVDGKEVVIINLLGQAFMKMENEITSPFRMIDDMLQKEKADIIIIDFHAETTGEKRTMSWYIDGRASLLVGTHTHVQTADETIQPKGLGYISDLGVCGAVESSLGMDIELVLQKVAQHQEMHLEPPSTYQHVQLQGVFVTIDSESGRTTHMERVDRRVEV